MKDEGAGCMHCQATVFYPREPGRPQMPARSLGLAAHQHASAGWPTQPGAAPAGPSEAPAKRQKLANEGHEGEPIIRPGLLSADSRAALKAEYSGAGPYPHVVLKEVCDPAKLRAVREEVRKRNAKALGDMGSRAQFWGRAGRLCQGGGALRGGEARRLGAAAEPAGCCCPAAGDQQH